MIDKEKVINGLEHEISRANIPTCGTDFIDCVEVALLRDAIALLKAQNKDSEIVRKAREGRILKHVGDGIIILNFGWWKGIVERDGFKVVPSVEDLQEVQEPRVMTIEEVTEDRPDVVWFDDRHYKLTYPAFVSNGKVTGWVVSLSQGCLERHNHIDGYGKTWRCWTSRPTDEQREVTEWKD